MPAEVYRNYKLMDSNRNRLRTNVSPANENFYFPAALKVHPTDGQKSRRVSPKATHHNEMFFSVPKGHTREQLDHFYATGSHFSAAE